MTQVRPGKEKSQWKPLEFLNFARLHCPFYLRRVLEDHIVIIARSLLAVFTVWAATAESKGFKRQSFREQTVKTKKFCN